jgi:hypothetical protein
MVSVVLQYCNTQSINLLGNNLKYLDFSVDIPEGREIPTSKGVYVELRHRSYYRVALTNGIGRKVGAELWIDGKRIETFVLNPFQIGTIEGPPQADSSGQVQVDEKFTFYRVGSEEGDRAQLNASDPNLGLIKVVFKPVKERPLAYASRGLSSESYGASKGAGGTGLSGYSGQKMNVVETLDYEDASQHVTLYLRLREDVIKPLGSSQGPSTPIPPMP